MGDLVSFQWALNETVDSLYGAVRAATSDNIPPGALVIAQSFGSELAVCVSTKMCVEQLVMRYHRSRRSHTIGFLKSRIGFARGDSIDQLGSSEGGIRFLALAAALLCTCDSFFAARTLHSLLLETASEAQKGDVMFPTIKMLQQLLTALEHRLCRAGFAEYVSGWQIPLRSCDLGQDGNHPSLGIIKALVLSFSAVDRLGPDGRVEVRVHAGIPWIIAFTCWCLGEVPCVVASDGTVVLGELDHKVLLRVNNNSLSKEEVRTIHKIESPDTVWSGPSLPPNERPSWSGMLSVGNYGTRHLISRGITSPEALRALCEALSFSIPLVLRKLWPRKTTESGVHFHPALGYDNYSEDTSKSTFNHFRSHMFGNPRKLEAVMKIYLGAENISLALLPNDHEMQRLPALEAYLQELVSNCGCSVCSHDSDDYEVDGSLGLKVHHPGSPTNLAFLAASFCGKAAQNSDVRSNCSLMRLWAFLSIFTAEILAISLYDTIEDIQLFWQSEAAVSSRIDGRFTNAIYECLFWYDRFNRMKNRFCRVQDVLQLATSLLGHDVQKELESSTWVASACRGQVIFPLIFDLGELTSNPLLLGGRPGRLSFENSYFEKIISRSPRPDEMAVSAMAPTFVPDSVKILPHKDDLNWQIGLTADSPELFFGTPRAGLTIYNPHDVFSTIARSLFVKCTHSKYEFPQTPTEDCIFVDLPFFNNFNAKGSFDFVSQYASYITWRNSQHKDSPFKIQILPTAGKEGLRLFAMVSPFPGVVNDGACLECCIEVCRKSGLEYIVL